MKIIKKILITLVVLIALVVALAYIFKVDYLLTASRTIYLKGHTTAFLEDYKEFDNRTLHKSTNPQPWAIHKDYNKVAPTEKLTATHKELKTIAYVIIKNDSIWHESYFDGFNEASKTNSFSMAKSIVTAALGRAITEGKIKSLDQKVSDFYPQYNKGFAAQLTVGDLSSMSSGMDFIEKYYSPFCIVTETYFTDDLEKVMLGLPIIEEPGKRFNYQSGSTELLAMCITKATGEKLTDYVSKNFWQTMGAENDALWQVDKEDGIEKAFCCIASNARDFARFGKLYKQKGNWNGNQILDTVFVEKCITPRFKESPEYGYGWWMSNHKNKKIFSMRGHLGQYVITIPEDNLIIVRLGHLKGEQKKGDTHPESFYIYVDEAYKMLENAEKN